MIKQMFVIRGRDSESYAEFKTRILALAQNVSSQSTSNQLKVCITDNPPPKRSIIPFKKSKIAVLSLQSTESDVSETILDFEGLAGGYTVDEAIPVAYHKKWDDGEATPGVCLLTLFRQRPDLEYDTFLHRWHHSHTPLSLKIHPLWNYNRNVVKMDILDGSQYWDGIVEEQFKTASDLLNPLKFFGNPLAMTFNMIRVYTDTRSFIEYKSIEPYFATEYWIKS